MKEHKGRRPDPHGLHQTLSIEKFADVKHSGRVDKQRLAQKQRLVRIKRGKQYNKVKQKLIQEGKYPEQPSFPSLEEEEEQQDAAQQPAADRAASGKHTSSSFSSKPSEPTQRHAPSKDGQPRAGAAQPDTDEPEPQAPHAAAGQPGQGPKKKHKKKSSLQILAEKRDKEQEELRQKQEEARKAAQQRQAVRAAADRKRKKQTVKLFKKTKKGQPIMKYRLEKILDTLTKS